MNSLVSSLTTFTDNISDNLNNITSLISNTVIENPIIRTVFQTENHNDLQKEDHDQGVVGDDPGGRTIENVDADHKVDPKKINSEETMRKGYSEDVPDANPDYQPAYDTQEQPWPWSMNQR